MWCMKCRTRGACSADVRASISIAYKPAEMKRSAVARSMAQREVTPIAAIVRPSNTRVGQKIGENGEWKWV